jgi:hypothetical protein
MSRALAFIILFVAACMARPAFAVNDHHVHDTNATKPLAASGARSAKELVERAVRYEHGEGVEQNYAQALSLYCEAAALSQPDAYFNLGWMFLNGRGVPQNDAIAVLWFGRAARNGIGQAFNILQMLGQVQGGSPPSDGCPGSARAPSINRAPQEVQQLVTAAAQAIGLNPRLVLAVIAVESAFNRLAVSPKNAQGLMQLLPETAVRFGVRDPFDEKENVRGGVTYLHDLLKRFNGDLILALAAYNAGEQVIIDRGGVPPYPETKDYIGRVTRLCACSDNPFAEKAH